MTTARNHWRVCHEISRIFISKINSDLRFGLTKKYEIYAELQNCRLHFFVAHETIKIWCRLGAFRWRLPSEPDRKWDKYRCNRNTRCHSEFFRSFLAATCQPEVRTSSVDVEIYWQRRFSMKYYYFFGPRIDRKQLLLLFRGARIESDWNERWQCGFWWLVEYNARALFAIARARVYSLLINID